MTNIGSIVYALLGASASILLLPPEIRKMQKRKATTEKLKMVREALEEAEERVIRCEEGHDLMLSQLCSYYMINQNLEEALAGARRGMNEALDFSDALRNLQMEIIASL